MRYEMKMPDLATTGSEMRVVRWLVETGQLVRRGQPLLEIETDKATMEVESTVDGTLSGIVANAEARVAEGDVIATLDVGDSGTKPAPTAPVSKPSGMFARNRAAATPAPGIAKTQAATAAPAAGVAMSPAHRTAARRLQESKQTVPHFYLQTSFNAASIIARRKAAEPTKLAWDAFFARAIARALAKFDRMSLRIDSTGERLVHAPSEAIGVAVDADGELYVIAVANPASRAIEDVSLDIRAAADRIRSGNAEVRRLPQVAMTLSNLGSSNVESFVPIISMPEAAILGIGKVMPTCVARPDGRIAVEPRASLTLAVDHRVVSGKYAGDFLGAIVSELESSS
jgi:pyruvate dehydrogenase E2 component (dihydrolipoamide acetyltransferase)